MTESCLGWLRPAAAGRCCNFHGGDVAAWYRGAPAPVRWLIRATLRRADALLAITRDTEHFLRSVAPKTATHYLPNFVPLRGLERAAGGADAAAVEVLFVGWLLKAKGVLELTRAIAGIPGLHLTLAGPIHREFFDGELEPKIRALGTRVRVLGALSHDEVCAQYRRAHIFALPSHQEGFPLVVVEAMASGLPVVSTRVGAIPDVVRDGVDGFLVAARDAEALEARLRELAEDPALRERMGQAGRDRASRFERGAVVRELATLYRELLVHRS